MDSVSDSVSAKVINAIPWTICVAEASRPKGLFQTQQTLNRCFGDKIVKSACNTPVVGLNWSNYIKHTAGRLVRSH